MKHLLYLAVALSTACFQLIHAQTWLSLNGPQIASNVKDISVTNSGSIAYISDADFVLKSTNNGASWAVTPQPYQSPLLVLVKPNDGNIVLAAKDGQMVYGTNGGDAWTAISGLTDLTPLRLVAAVNDNAVMLLGRTYVTNNSAIWRSANSGASWSKVTAFPYATDIHDFAPYSNNTDGWPVGLIWAGGMAPSGTPGGSSNSSVASTNGLWYSTDYGVTWAADRLGNRNIGSLVLVPRSYPTSYIRLVVENISSSNDGVLRNTDLGSDTWTQVTLSPAPADIHLIRRKNSNGYLFLATSNGVWRSSNEGVSFQRIGLAGTDVLTIAVTPTTNDVFAGTVSSLYKSTDNGDTWVEIIIRSPNQGSTRIAN